MIASHFAVHCVFDLLNPWDEPQHFFLFGSAQSAASSQVAVPELLGQAWSFAWHFRSLAPATQHFCAARSQVSFPHSIFPGVAPRVRPFCAGFVPLEDEPLPLLVLLPPLLLVELPGAGLVSP